MPRKEKVNSPTWLYTLRVGGSPAFPIVAASALRYVEMDNSMSAYSPKGWIRTSPVGGQTIVEWYDGKSRAILAPCYRMGRRRAGAASDRLGVTALQLGYRDYSFTSLERNYSNYLPEIQNKGDGTVLLILR